MNKITVLTFLALSTAGTGFSKTSVLTDDRLVKMVNQKVPSVVGLEVESEAARYKQRILKGQYGSRLSLGRVHLDTTEKPSSPYSPIFAPATSTFLEFSKKHSLGLSSSLKLDMQDGTLQSQGARDVDISEGSLSATLAMDLWKNIFGRLDRANLDSAKLAKEYEVLNKSIKKNQFKIEIRKLYWRLMANKLSTEISKKLYEAAIKQERHVKRRYKSFASDKGEVARFSSLVSSRKGNLLYLEFEKETLLSKLKELVPELGAMSFVLPAIDMDLIVADVMSCVAVITNEKSAPLHYTSYDELNQLLTKKLEQDLRIANSHDQIDLSLKGSYAMKGTNASLSDALSDARSGEVKEYQAGIYLTVPLGGTTRAIQESDVRLKQLSHKAQYGTNLAKLESTHNYIVKAISLLMQAISEQQTSNTHLNVRLKNIRKKFSQGRISVAEVVADEDSFLGSELMIVQTQLTIIETILDYMGVFQEVQCSFNKV